MSTFIFPLPVLSFCFLIISFFFSCFQFCDSETARQPGKFLIGHILNGTETDLSPCSRFVNVPINTVNKRLTRESGEATAEISNLEKKLQYHETTNQKSRENLEQILKSGGRS